MADVVNQRRTSLGSEDVIVRAVQFFSTENWRPTSQSQRAATFQGKPAIPWFMLLLTFVGFMMCIVPGVIMYIMVIRKMYRFQNLVVTATPVSGGTEVVVQNPKPATGLVTRFLGSLPPHQPVAAGFSLSPAPAGSAAAAQGAFQFCINCGAKNEAGSQFCGSCGTRQ